MGNPLRLEVTVGQAEDLHEAITLVEGFAFERLIADREYAAQAFYDWVVAQEMEPVIPPHQRTKGALAQRPYDRWCYRERHLVDYFINKIKHFSRVFSRYDKPAGHFLGFLQFVNSLIWLR